MNSKEIANLAGVSRSTVSRVLNNYKNVPESTRLKVQSVIDKYGYNPNLSARALAGQVNDIVEIVIADIYEGQAHSKWYGINSPYFTQLIYSIIKECQNKNQMVLINIITDRIDYNKLTANYENKMIRGGIFIGFSYHNNDLVKLIENGYNIVVVDSFNEDDSKSLDIKTVNCDNYEAGILATNCLIKNGHKNIGFIEGDSRLSSKQRKEGFLDAMNEANLPILPNSIKKGYYNEFDGYIAAKKLLADNKITAILSSNDIMAVGAIKAIEELNLNIPNDISLIGFDNNQLPTNNNLNLTSVYFDLNELSIKCVNSIFDEKPVYIQCSPKLYKGSSIKYIN